VTGAIVFAALLAVLLAWPQGRDDGHPTPGSSTTIDLVDDVALELTPSIRDRGWRATFPSNPYTLDLRATVRNESDDVFPRSIDVRVVEDPGASSERRIPERWASGLELANVPAGESAAYDLSYHAYGECGDFLATVEFVPSLGSKSFEQVEIPFTVGDEECRAD